MRPYTLLLAAIVLGGATPYPAMAPIDRYRMANRSDEISLARSAAPPSVSANAEVFVLGRRGYDVAARGSNGFACLVERSWAAGFDDPQFWNPSIRGPICFNPAAVRTELPQVLTRTQWVLAGIDKNALMARTRAAFARHAFLQPAPDAMSFMLSKRGYLGDAAKGPWLPHLMLFVPSAQAAAWGADLKGSPVFGSAGDDTLGSTILMIPVRRWSDGTPAVPRSAH